MIDAQIGSTMSETTTPAMNVEPARFPLSTRNTG